MKKSTAIIALVLLTLCLATALTPDARAGGASYSIVSPQSATVPVVKVDGDTAIIANISTGAGSGRALYKYTLSSGTPQKLADFDNASSMGLLPAGNGNFPVWEYAGYNGGQNLYNLHLYRNGSLQRLFAAVYNKETGYYKNIDTMWDYPQTYDGSLAWVEVGYLYNGSCDAGGGYDLLWEYEYKLLDTSGNVTTQHTTSCGAVCGEAWGACETTADYLGGSITSEGDNCAWISGDNTQLMINGTAYPYSREYGYLGFYEGALYQFDTLGSIRFDTAAAQWTAQDDMTVAEALDRLYHQNTYRRHGAYDVRIMYGAGPGSMYIDTFEIVDTRTGEQTYVPGDFSTGTESWTVIETSMDKLFDFTADGLNIFYVVEQGGSYAVARAALGGSGLSLSAGAANPDNSTFPIEESMETRARILVNHAALTNNTEGSVTVSAMQYALTGDNGTDGLSAYLFRDSTCDGSGYVQVGPATVQSGALQFSGLAENIRTGDAQCYSLELWSTPDRLPVCKAVGATLTPEAVTADAAVSGPDVAGTVRLGDCAGLYRLQYEVSTANPLASFTLIEPSTAEVLAVETFYGENCSRGGTADLEGLGGAPGERFYYTLADSGSGSQLLSVYSSFANAPLTRLGYCRGRPEEVRLTAPTEVTGCSFYTLDECEVGAQVQNPYENCDVAYAGFVKVIAVYPASVRWPRMRRYLLEQLQTSPYWQPGDVTLRRQVTGGSLRSALIYIDTRACLQRVIDALPGNPDITREDERQLWVEYTAMEE